MRGRPGLIGDYRSDAGIFRSKVQYGWFALLIVSVVMLGLNLSGELMTLSIIAMFAAIGAIGLNIVTGFAGQVSLGHAFFLGVGAFTAAVLGGVPDERMVPDPETGEMITQTVRWGLELDLIVWLPAAGLAAALAGFLVAPVAFRLRGLYLAFVTLGLVVLGDHVFREFEVVTGGVGIGRASAVPELLGFRFDEDGGVWGLIHLAKEQKLFFLGLGLLIVMGFAAKNLARSRVGRALSAVRDRDIAAEIMGIPLARYKLIAFTISSFYAGIAGALLFSVIGRLQPESFNLLVSIEYIAMILIGGVATISGSIMGAAFITFLPRIVAELADVSVSGVELFAFISDQPVGGFLTVSQVELILFGMLIVLFLIFEPLGMYGVWIRIRNYWKAWPFSY